MPTLVTRFRHFFLCFFSAVFIPVCGHSQWTQSTAISVKQGAKELQAPWSGGITTPLFSQFDLNNDNQPELTYFDRTNGKVVVLTLENVDNSVRFVQNLALAATFPEEVYDWMLLRDFDCDGDADLFYGSMGSLHVFENTGGLSFPEFTFFSSALLTTIEYKTSTETAPVYCASTDFPAIQDIDNDGDLDILSFAVGGGYIEYHKNLSVEKTGNCGLDMYIKNFCWGYMEEGLSDNTFALGQKCDFQLKNPEKSGGGHAGSSVFLLDVDNNGRKDALVGDIGFNNLVAVKMGKSTPGGDSALSSIPNFPENNPVNISSFPGAFEADFNLDGKQDLLIAPGNPNGINNYSSIWAYKNTRTTVPNFELVQQNFLQDQMIELGEASYPILYDINQDGLTDLFVSSKGFSDGGAEFISKIAYYKNTGTKAKPEFSLIDDNWGNLPSIGLGFAHYASLSRIDKTTFIAFGDHQGYIHWAEIDESGAMTNLIGYVKEGDNSEADVGQFSTPVLVDYDADGTLDILSGSRNGKLFLFKNIGTNQNPKLTEISNNFGNLFPGNTLNLFTSLQIDDNLMYLGQEHGYLSTYDVNFNTLTATLLDRPFNQEFVGFRVCPAVGDLTQDNIPDLITGNKAGGLFLFLTEEIVGIEKITQPTVSLFPNPNQGEFSVSSSATIETIEIYSPEGKLISSYFPNDKSATLSLKYQKGLYFVRITTTFGTETKQLLVR